MANTSAPFGFSQTKGTGSVPTYEQVASICAYNTGAMYYGDPVTRDSGGYVIPVASTSPSTSILSGVFIGCKYLSVSQSRTVWSRFWGAADVASTNTVEVYLINDPNAQFLAQTGSTAATVAMVGQNAQFLYGTPNTTTGLSGAYVDIAQTPTTTATWPFKITGLVTAPPGANGTQVGAYNYVTVAFNNVETKTLTGAV